MSPLNAKYTSIYSVVQNFYLETLSFNDTYIYM